jgi:serine/threonine protein kinase/tetratricopeptide (TPR) repeat protein
MIGQTVAHFQIVARLGGGGMGVVYRAEDLKLQRQVALKFLSPQWSADKNARDRFIQEAKAASSLDHPNTCTIHQIDTTPDGHLFIVMSFYPGETVEQRLARGPLPAEDAAAIALGAARGLAKAHGLGIVHRDIKPSNLIITQDGIVKVLDFGIAKLAGEAGFTEVGRVMGSAEYMSPEQLRGTTVDARTDVWSLGVVLYEMVTGRKPFRGASRDGLYYSILESRPEPPSTLVRGLPLALERAIERSLAKDPWNRFRDMDEMVAALGGSVDRDTPTAPTLTFTRTQDTPRRWRSIAVLPFVDMSPGQERGSDGPNAHLGVGLADAVIAELAQIRSLLVRPTSSILRFQDRSTGPGQAARDLAVDAIVDGSFQRVGQRLRVTVQLIDALDLRSLWAAKMDLSMDDLFQMQDEVSRKIVETLVQHLTPEDERRLEEVAHAHRPGGAAYELYMRGKICIYRDTLPELLAAADWFGRARDLDPSFALPWAGLGDAYARISYLFDPEGDWYHRAQESCDRALVLDPALPEAHYVRARLLWTPQGGFDHAGALRNVAHAIAGRPNLEEARLLLGVVLQHVGMLAEAMREIDRALALSPDDMLACEQRVLCFYEQCRFVEALAAGEEVCRRDPSPGLVYQNILALLQLGKLDEAEATLASLRRSWPDELLAYPLAGLLAALRGDAAEARRQIDLTVQNRRGFGHYHHAQYDIACIHALLGDHAPAVAWLTDAARNGYPCVPLFLGDPLLASVQEHPDFKRLIDDLRREGREYEDLYRQLRQTA